MTGWQYGLVVGVPVMGLLALREWLLYRKERDDKAREGVAAYVAGVVGDCRYAPGTGERRAGEGEGQFVAALLERRLVGPHSLHLGLLAGKEGTIRIEVFQVPIDRTLSVVGHPAGGEIPLGPGFFWWEVKHVPIGGKHFACVPIAEPAGPFHTSQAAFKDACQTYEEE